VTKLPNTITALIEITLNRYLSLDPDAKRNFPALSEKVIQINIRDLDIVFFMKVSGGRIEVLPSYDDEIHCAMKASILSLMKLGVASDASVLGEDIEMSGDLDVGRQFRNLLARVDIDWEEIASRYMGDIVAHKLGNAVRSLTGWGKKTSNSLRKDVGEYLQEESRQLPTAFEVSQFVAGVDDVRMGVDRAEARFKQLQKQIQEKFSGNNEALE
jgi:ubiquinone biosynthesis protein UbiJ